MKPTRTHLANLIKKHYIDKKPSFSKQCVFCRKPITVIKRYERHLYNLTQTNKARLVLKEHLPFVVHRHQSLLMRKLGSVDMALQQKKITNLGIAIQSMDGLLIKPGQTFSFWDRVKKPTKHKGYVKGMLLSGGKVVEGLGGGLCQLSNLLFWLFLHAPVQILERHHHSLDVFPDSARVLPFGSGATIFFNYLDLKVKNTSNIPLQLRLWLTSKHLKGQIRSVEKYPKKYHLFQKHHMFIKHEEQYYRYNQIFRETVDSDGEKNEEKIITNLAPVLYPVTEKYLKNRDYPLLKI